MPWVCLMYHDVVDGSPGRGGGPDRFSVSVESFEQMLRAVGAAGYAGCSLAEALAPGDRPRVGITFDDGTLGQFDRALPVLLAQKMTATFFVTTDWVGKPGFMGWEQLRQLAGLGMSVQSHTKSHPHLSELDRDRLWSELADSKAALDDALGQDTQEIALPGGNAPRSKLRHLMEEAGYRVVATSRWGGNADVTKGAAGSSKWIRRCTVPPNVTHDLALRIASGDPRLTAARYPREATLNAIRALLGASRYHRWRRRVLDLVAGTGR